MELHLGKDMSIKLTDFAYTITKNQKIVIENADKR